MSNAIYDITLDQIKSKSDENVINFLAILSKSRTIKTTFMTVQRLSYILNQIDKGLLSKAARAIRDYKQAITYFEMKVKPIRDANFGMIDDELIDIQEYKHIAECYNKVFPEDYDQDETRFISGMSRSSSQASLCDAEDHTEPSNNEVISPSLKQFYKIIDSNNHHKIRKVLSNSTNNRDTSFLELCYLFEFDYKSLNHSDICLDLTSKPSNQTFYIIVAMVVTKMWRILNPSASNDRIYSIEHSETIKIHDFVLEMLNKLKLIISELLVKTEKHVSSQLNLYMH